MPREPLRGTVFAEVAVERMSDADALLRERRYNGAIYMAGYAVECALKAALCRHQVETWLTVDEQSHDLSAYAARMGLQHTIQTQPAMRQAWKLVMENWSVDIRYRPSKGNERLARRVVDAAAELLIWVNGRFIGGHR